MVNIGGVKVRVANLQEMLAINKAIPEFSQPYGLIELQKRLKNKVFLGLIAELDGQAVGFKLGYGLDPVRFYSWLGGVVPEARRLGVAELLLAEQETWVRGRAYQEIRVKTRNQHRSMLTFLLKHQYNIVGFEAANSVAEHRVRFSKMIDG